MDRETLKRVQKDVKRLDTLVGKLRRRCVWVDAALRDLGGNRGPRTGGLAHAFYGKLHQSGDIHLQ